MEHLLARLELDDAPVCKRIVELTFNSYIPTDKPPEVCYCLTVVYVLTLLYYLGYTTLISFNQIYFFI